MSLPPLIRESEATEAEWKRKVRDALNGLIRANSSTGTTAQRPLGPSIGWRHYDTTLGIPVWWNGTVWKNAAGTTV